MMRKPITERMKIDALLWRYTINCYRCKMPFAPADKVEWDHVEALALGGPHDFSNIAPMHKECHVAKTRGTGATTAGSDIGKIKKARHIATGKMAIKVKSVKLLCEGGPSPCQCGGYAEGDAIMECERLFSDDLRKRKWPTRKMKSRPFQKGKPA